MSNGGWVSVPLTATVGIKLSGRIFRTGGAGVPSVPVELHGTSSGSTTTDADGAYSFFVLPGTYTVVPASPTLTFTPVEPNGDGQRRERDRTRLRGTEGLAGSRPAEQPLRHGRPVATAFATIINAGHVAASGCGISPMTSVLRRSRIRPRTHTNELTGTADTP